MEILLPFGRGTLPLRADGATVLRARSAKASGADEDALVRAAMAAPIGSPSLRELARGKKRATLIVSDHTRPVPSRRIVPHMLAELRAGNPDIEITLLAATGCHRASTREELCEKLGEDIALREKIVVHDCDDARSLVPLGKLPSGAELIVNRLAAETDLLVSEGFIEPHFFAGFSGGRKSVLPGVCARKTVLGNHCAAFIDSPFARTGVLEGNPIHRDMLAAARMAKLRYIVNVCIDERKRVVAAFAGDAEQAHAAGCRSLAERARVRPDALADIVVSTNGGYPLDQNIYQAVKGLTAAEAAGKPNATLILCASCRDGAGGERFFRMLRDAQSPAQLLEEIRKTPMEHTAPDQWEAQILARVLDGRRAIFVSEPCARKTLAQMHIETASSPDEALAMARAEKGERASLTVIPDGVSVIVDAAEKR